MKSSLAPSLGSLAAMAALALPATVDGQVVMSNITDLTVSNGQTSSIDLDGNGSTDFYIDNYGPGGRWFSNALSTSLIFANSGSPSSMEPFWLGDVVPFSGGTTGSYNFDLVGGGVYAGINFLTGGTQHAGWVLFDISGGNVVLKSAAWETTSGLGIEAGATGPAIPEPAHYAAGFGLLSGFAAWLRRRRASS